MAMLNVFIYVKKCPWKYFIFFKNKLYVGEYEDK